MERYDVAVVGAGLAGLQVARLLARRGLSVALIDRKRSVDQVVHTTGIFVRRTIEDFELPDAFLGRAIRDVRLTSPRGRTVTFSSEHDEFRIGRMRELYGRLFLDAVSAGCDWIGNASLKRIASGATESRVVLSVLGVERTIKAAFVVGADGATSRVARHLGLHENREWIVGAEAVHRSRGGSPVMHCFLDRELAPGYIAWSVDDGESVHVGVGGDPRRFRADVALATLQRRMQLTSAPIETRGGRIPVGGIGRRLASRRGLLVGDAAGAVSPLTAGGLDGALRLSAYAAEIIARHLSGDPAAIAAYSGARFETRLVSRKWMRRAFNAMQSGALTEIGVALLRQRPFHALGRHIFFGRGSFPIAIEELDRAATVMG